MMSHASLESQDDGSWNKYLTDFNDIDDDIGKKKFVDEEFNRQLNLLKDLNNKIEALKTDNGKEFKSDASLQQSTGESDNLLHNLHNGINRFIKEIEQLKEKNDSNHNIIDNLTVAVRNYRKLIMSEPSQAQQKKAIFEESAKKIHALDGREVILNIIKALAGLALLFCAAYSFSAGYGFFDRLAKKPPIPTSSAIIDGIACVALPLASAVTLYHGVKLLADSCTFFGKAYQSRKKPAQQSQLATNAAEKNVLNSLRSS